MRVKDRAYHIVVMSEMNESSTWRTKISQQLKALLQKNVLANYCYKIAFRLPKTPPHAATA